jgi:VanZ family protein
MKKTNWPLRILLACMMGVCCIGVMLLMYKLSSETSSVSGLRSQIVTESLKEEVSALLSQSEKGLSLKEKMTYWLIQYAPEGWNWETLVRKLAHFSIYFMIALTCWCMLALLKVKPVSRLIVVLAICGIFALSDELHQQYSYGRVMSSMDVMIDFAGAFCSVALCSFISWIFRFLRWLFS